jgi:acetyltransferase
MENSLRAVRSLNRYAEFLRQRVRNDVAPAGPSAVAEQAREQIRAAGGRPLVEREAKTVSIAALNGYPVVLKVESPDIQHKTEAGGVLLGLDSADAVRAGFEQIMRSARQHEPDAQIDGVLVQEMLSGGRELIVGMTQDATFGPAVAVGLGGIFVEVLRDVALGVPPLTAEMAREMLGRLRGRAILDGSGGRGAPPADLDAIIDILQRFGQLCVDVRDEVAAIDINPLLVFPRGLGARVVDCLIVPA